MEYEEGTSRQSRQIFKGPFVGVGWGNGSLNKQKEGHGESGVKKGMWWQKDTRQVKSLDLYKIQWNTNQSDMT